MFQTLTPNDFLRRASRHFPEKLALVDEPKQFTYAELQSRANRLSNALLALGVEKGDRVAILSPNTHFHKSAQYWFRSTTGSWPKIFSIS
jgi:fatty-acyl-CoA synthase